MSKTRIEDNGTSFKDILHNTFELLKNTLLAADPYRQNAQ